MEGEQQTTLRDTVAATFDAVIPDADNPPVSTPESVPLPSDPPAAATPKEGETQAQADERARDEKGRFAAKPAESAAAPKADTPKAPNAAQAIDVAAADTPKPIQRPSSWKKEHWEAFDKLAKEQPLVAQYILQRETEAARGVSAYKTEWDRAKPLVQAFEPHRADFERWGIDPGAQFSKYVEIHKGLALGSEEQKLGMLMRLAHDYKIPVEKMFVQQNGQVYFNPQVQPTAPQPQGKPYDPQAIRAEVQAVISQERTAADIAAMANDAVKYPHFETVRETMAQLLDANLANDLPGAYDMALALPQHRELVASQQQQLSAQAEAERKTKAAAEAQRARAAAVSPRSATPASAPAQARKGLRETLAEQVEAVGSGRV